MISHKPSAIVIFQTQKYEQFEMINGNRGLNLSKINKIIKEIEAGNDMLPYYPIQVRVEARKMHILDGQHRYFISRKLGKPVYYIIVHEQKSMADIARVNSNVEKWKPIDFVNCYLNQGSEEYKKLKEFIDLFGFSPLMCAKILANGSPGVEGTDLTVSENFQNGTFKVNYWEEGLHIANSCKRFSFFLWWKDRAFIIAVYRIMKAGLIEIEKLALAAEQNTLMLSKQPNQKSYVNMLEQVVNKGKQKRIIII